MKDYELLLDLRDKVDYEILDSLLLLELLKGYASPRNIITKWLKRGDLVQIKKGLYIFGPRFRKTLIDLEVIANLLFGPSYISCEYAMQFHGLIPEAVHEITSVTTKRNKTYDTPLGRFSYRHLNETRYATGIAWLPVSNKVHAFIATPEKALADMLFLRNIATEDANELLNLITQSYRIDMDSLAQMDLLLMVEIVEHYRHPTINQLLQVLKGIKHASKRPTTSR